MYKKPGEKEETTTTTTTSTTNENNNDTVPMETLINFKESREKIKVVIPKALWNDTQGDEIMRDLKERLLQEIKKCIEQGQIPLPAKPHDDVALPTPTTPTTTTAASAPTVAQIPPTPPVAPPPPPPPPSTPKRILKASGSRIAQNIKKKKLKTPGTKMSDEIKKRMHAIRDSKGRFTRVGLDGTLLPSSLQQLSPSTPSTETQQIPLGLTQPTTTTTTTATTTTTTTSTPTPPPSLSSSREKTSPTQPKLPEKVRMVTRSLSKKRKGDSGDEPAGEEDSQDSPKKKMKKDIDEEETKKVAPPKTPEESDDKTAAKKEVTKKKQQEKKLTSSQDGQGDDTSPKAKVFPRDDLGRFVGRSAGGPTSPTTTTTTTSTMDAPAAVGTPTVPASLRKDMAKKAASEPPASKLDKKRKRSHHKKFSGIKGVQGKGQLRDEFGRFARTSPDGSSKKKKKAKKATEKEETDKAVADQQGEKKAKKTGEAIPEKKNLRDKKRKTSKSLDNSDALDIPYHPPMFPRTSRMDLAHRLPLPSLQDDSSASSSSDEEEIILVDARRQPPQPPMRPRRREKAEAPSSPKKQQAIMPQEEEEVAADVLSAFFSLIS